MKFKKLFGRKKQNRRAPRANEFMLESLEPRLLLSATPMIAAAVTTDHLDYAPGETAVITASNTAGDGVQFAAGELVRFQVTRTDGMADVAGTTADAGPAGNEAWYVIDGVGGFTAHLGSDVSGDGIADWIAPDNDHMVNGSVSSTWFVEEQYRNSSLLVTATGQESGAVATQAFTDANLNTTTVVTSSGASIYGDTVTLTATVTPAVGGTTRPVGSVEFFDNGVSLGVMSSAGIGAGSSSTFALTVSSLTAGSHAVTAVFTGGANVSDSFNNSTSGILTQTVSQKALVGSFGADNKTYDGTTVATVLFADFGVGQLVGNDFVTLDGGIATFDTKNAGFDHIVTLTGATLGGADASNYSLASITTTIADIDQAIALVTVNGFTGAFDGLPHGATGTVLGVDVGGAALGSSLNLGLQFTAVGTYVADWVFNGGINYTNQTGSVAIVISNAVTTTTTTVSSSAATSTYGDAVTFTATVSAGSGTVAPTGTVAFFDGVTLLGTDSVVDSTGVGTSTWSFTTASLKAGAHAIHAVYSATGSFSGSQSTDISQTVNQKSLTGSFTAANKVYDATTAATLTRILTGVLGTDVVTLTGTGTFDTKDVGTGKVVTITGAGLAGADAGNYSLTANSTTTANVTALGITGSFTAANKVYDATTTATLTRTLTGVLGADVVTLTGTGTFDTKNVGTGKVVTITGAGLTGADAGNYSLTANSTTTANITALGITGSFTAANKVYDTTTTATVQIRTLTGVIAGDSVSLVGGTAAFGNANAGLNKIVTLTGAGLTGTDSGNYSLTSVNTTTADITALGLTGSFTAANKVYDATTTAALTRTLTGVLGADVVVLVGTGTFDTKDVGTGKIVTITGAGLTGAAAGNYSLTANSTTTADITKAIAQVSVSGFTGAFDGLPHGATGTVLGVDAGGAALGSSLNLGAQFTLVGTYLVDWVFTGGTNYTDQSGSVTIVISDAVTATTTTVSSSAATSTYGDAVTFTATVNAGSGTVAPTGTVAFFDGATLLGSDSVANSTGVGTSTWSFTTASLNAGAHAIHAVYSATGGFADSTSADITQTVSKAVATVTVSGFTGTYNAAAHGATGSATGVAGDLAAAGSSLNLGASFTNAPGGTANWVFTGGLNYTDQSGSVAIVINKAVATVTVSGFTGTYDAAAHGATGSATGVAGDLAAAGSSLNLGASFTNAPGGTANWVFTGGLNYTDQSGSVAIVINKAVATVTVSGFTGTYNAAAHGATGSATGVAGDLAAAGSSLNLGASFTNAPGGTANWVFTGGLNYTDQSGSVAIVINKAVATVTVSGFTGTYDAAAHGATGSATGVAGDLAAAGSSLNLGASFTNAPGGTANWVFTGGLNYTDQSGSVAIVINKAVATVTVSGFTGTYNAAAHGATGSATGVAGDLAAAGSSLNLGASFTNAPGGTANWVFTGGLNYTDQSGSVAIVINKAVALVTVTGFTGPFDGLAHGATGAVLGVDVGGAALGTSLNLGASFINAPGGTANWVFTGGLNYTDQSGSVAIVITNVVVSTTTTVSSNAATSIYGNAVTFTAIVTAGSGNAAPTGSVAFFDGATLLGSDSVANSTGVGTSTWSITTASLTAGAHAIHAVYSATGNFSGSQSANMTQTVNQRSLTGNFTAANKVYDATTGAVVQTSTLTGVLAGDSVSLIGGTVAFSNANVGLNKIVTLTGATLSGAAAGNYSLVSVNTTRANITAKSLTGSFTAANKVYDATTAAAVQIRTLTGVLAGDSVNLTGGTASFANANVGTGKVVTLTGAILTGAAQANYTLTSVNTTTANITALGLTGSFTAANKVYDATTAATLTRTLTGVLGADAVTLTGTGTFDTKDVGTGKVVTITGVGLTGAAAGNYSLTANSTTTANITAKSLTGSFTAANKVYDATTAAAVQTRTLTGVIGVEVVNLTGGTASFANANVGTGKVVTLTGAILTGAAQANYTLTSVNTTTANITALGITGSFTAANKVYDATTTATLTRTLTGVLGADAVTLAGTGTFDTKDVGTGKVVTITGAGLTGAAAGNYSLTANSTTTADISKAIAQVSVSGFTGGFDGLAHGATGTAGGADAGGAALGSNLNLGATFTNVPGGTANWTFLGGANYADQSGSVAIVINSTIIATTAAVSSSAATSIYGDAVTFTATVSAGLGSAAPTGTVAFFDGATLLGTASVADSTGVGTATWSLTIANLNAAAHAIHAVYSATGTFAGSQSADMTQTVNKAVATLTVTGYNGVYSGVAEQATGTALGVFGESLSGLDLSSTMHINAGTYTDTVTFTDVTGNYNNASVVVVSTIDKAVATVSVNGYTGIYDATAHGATIGGVSGVAGDLAATGSVLTLGGETFTNVPGGTATWAFTGGINYTDQSGSVAIVINKATVTITGTGQNGSGYFGTYDGQAHAATVTVKGVGGVTIETVASLTTHTNAGTYRDTVTYIDATGNYNNASKVVTSYILKATVTLTGAGQNGSGYFGTYDGQAHAATVMVKGVGGVTVGTAASLTSHTNAGTYRDTVTFLGDANYKAASKVVTSYILKASVTLTGAGQNGSGYFGTYDGTAHAATVTVKGVGGVTVGTVTSSTTHTNAGTYSDTVTFLGDANYKAASKTVKSYILKATVTMTGVGPSGSGYFGTYDGQAHAATVTVKGVGGVIVGTAASLTTHTNAGTYSDTVTFLGDANYKAASKTVKSYILKATATITVTGYNVVFDGNVHTATATATGVNGENLSAGLSLTGTTHTNVGIYLNDTVTFNGGANYKAVIKIVHDFIR